ncbi:hypothetical protein LAZ67_13000388, partial [Cordylochernes scorpioides]
MATNFIRAESPSKAEQKPVRHGALAQPCAELSANQDLQSGIPIDLRKNQNYVNPSAGSQDANSAAPVDLAAIPTSNAAAQVRRNWADTTEEVNPGAEEGFTLVQGRKRRRGSGNSPTTAAPSSNAGASRTIRRPQSSAGSVPRAQEIRATRAHIADARARQASSSEEHCVYIEHSPELEPFHYLRALDRKLGGTAGVIQITKVNGHQLLGLTNRGLAERLISEGLEVEGTLLRAFPFRKRVERITVGNLPFFVADSAVITALSPFGRITSIAPKQMKAGPYVYVDGWRDVFITLHEGITIERLPTRLDINIKGQAWPAYLSSGIRCSRCHGQGHRRAICPLLAGLANSTRMAPSTTPAGVPPPTTSAPPQRSAAQPPAPAPSNLAMEVCSAPPVARAVLHPSAPRPSPPEAPALPMEETPSAPPPVIPAPSLQAPEGSVGPRSANSQHPEPPPARPDFVAPRDPLPAQKTLGPAAPTPDVEMSIVEEISASSTSLAKNATRVDLDAFIEKHPSVSFAGTDALGLGREEVLDLLSSRTKAQRKGPLLSPPQCDALAGLIGQILDLRPGAASNLYKVLGQVNAELRPTPAAVPTPPPPAPRPAETTSPALHGERTSPDIATPPPPLSRQFIDACYDQANDIIYALSRRTTAPGPATPTSPNSVPPATAPRLPQQPSARPPPPASPSSTMEVSDVPPASRAAPLPPAALQPSPPAPSALPLEDTPPAPPPVTPAPSLRTPGSREPAAPTPDVEMSIVEETFASSTSSAKNATRVDLDAFIEGLPSVSFAKTDALGLGREEVLDLLSSRTKAQRKGPLLSPPQCDALVGLIGQILDLKPGHTSNLYKVLGQVRAELTKTPAAAPTPPLPAPRPDGPIPPPPHGDTTTPDMATSPSPLSTQMDRALMDKRWEALRDLMNQLDREFELDLEHRFQSRVDEDDIIRAILYPGDREPLIKRLPTRDRYTLGGLMSTAIRRARELDPSILELTACTVSTPHVYTRPCGHASRELLSFSPLARGKMSRIATKLVWADSPFNAEQMPGRHDQEAHPCAEKSANFDLQSKRSINLRTVEKCANSPAGGKDANSATSADFAIKSPFNGVIEAQRTWANSSEDVNPASENGFTVVKGKKRRRGSAESPEAAAHSSNARRSGTNHRQRTSTERVPRAQEIKTTRTHIVEARARQASSTEEHCLYIEHCPELEPYHYLKAIDEMVGGTSDVVQIAKVNGHLLLGLSNKALAERLINEGLEVEGMSLKTFPFYRRAARITIGNLPFFVKDASVIDALLPYGRITSIVPKQLKAGKYVYTDGRREAYIVPHDGINIESLPARLDIRIKGEAWPMYLTSGIRCSRCQGQGQRRANCPLLHGQSTTSRRASPPSTTNLPPLTAHGLPGRSSAAPTAPAPPSPALGPSGAPPDARIASLPSTAPRPSTPAIPASFVQVAAPVPPPEAPAPEHPASLRSAATEPTPPARADFTAPCGPMPAQGTLGPATHTPDVEMTTTEETSASSPAAVISTPPLPAPRPAGPTPPVPHEEEILQEQEEIQIIKIFRKLRHTTCLKPLYDSGIDCNDLRDAILFTEDRASLMTKLSPALKGVLGAAIELARGYHPDAMVSSDCLYCKYTTCLHSAVRPRVARAPECFASGGRKVSRMATNFTRAESPSKAEQKPVRHGALAQPCAELSANQDLQNEIPIVLRKNQNYVNPPAGGQDANSAAPVDLAAIPTSNAAAQVRRNWADITEEVNPGAEEGFTLVQGRKRRRGSANSPTAAAPFSNPGGSRTIRRPQPSAGSVPRAQEIRVTRAHIAEARARQASSSEEHCVYIEHSPELEPFHYLRALDRMLGGIAGVIQITKVNGHQLLGLTNRGLAERLISEGLEVEGTLLRAFPFRKRAERITVGLANNTRTAPPTTPAGVPPPTTPAPPQRSAAQPPAPTPSNPAMEVCSAPPVARAALHSSAPRPSPPAAPAFPMEETPPAPPPVTPAPSLQTPGSREPAAPTPDVEMSIVEETFASSTSSAKNATRVDLDAFIEGLPSVSFAKTDALGLGREEVLDLLSSRTKAQRKGPLLSPPQCDALVGLIGQIMDLKPGHTSNLYKVLGQVKAELRTTPAVPPTPTLPAPWPAKPTPPALHGEKTSPDIATPPPPLSTEFIDACYDQANDIIYELSDERYLETLSDIGVTEGMSSSASPGSSGSAEQEPGRPSIPAPTGGRISSENGNHKIILKENSENRVYANPPAGVKDVNLAAARDVTLNLPAGTSSNGAARVLVNWADCIEDLSPGAEDDFTVVKTKKRRRESSNSPTAAAPSSNSGGARSSRRLHSSARSVPRAQEIPTTRTHITEARARQASSSEEHCVYLEHGPELQPFHYLRALDRLLGGTAGIIQISKVNGHQLLGLANRGLAERLINNGLEVEGTLLRAFPFRKRAERITVSNLPFFVEDSAIINALRPFGRITSIAPKMMKAGPYTYTDGRREAFIVLHEGMTTERLPTRLNITIKGEAWPAYLSTGIKCSRCHGQGHRRANCPLLAGLANNTRTAPPTTPAGVPPPTTPAPPQRSAAQPPAPTPSNPAMEVCGAPPVARAALHSSAPRPSPPAAPAFPMEETPPAPPPVTPAPSLRTPGSREPAAPTPDVEMSIVEETFASSTSSAKNATRVDLDAFIEGLPSVSFAKTDALGLGREEVLDLLSSRTKAQRKGPLLSPPQCDALVGLIGQILDLKPGHTSNLYKVLGQVRAELTKTPAAAPTPPLPAPRPDGPIPPPPHGDTTTPDMATPPPPPSAQMEVDPIDKRCKELQLLTFELMKEFNPKPLPQFYSFELDLVEAVLYPEDREGFLGRFSPGDKKVLAQILDKLSTRDLDSLTLRGLSELRAALPPSKAEQKPVRHGALAQPCAELSANQDLQNEIPIVLRKNQNYVNPPAGGQDANSAAPVDLAAIPTSNAAAQVRRNWADITEEVNPGAEEGFTLVQGRKRRRGSANSPTAAAPFSNPGGSRTIRRPQPSAGSVPRAQEIRVTRAHIAEARARQASSSEEHCVYIEHSPELEPFHYLRALDRMLGGIAGVIQITKVNGHQLLGLTNRGLAERLIRLANNTRTAPPTTPAGVPPPTTPAPPQRSAAQPPAPTPSNPAMEVCSAPPVARAALHSSAPRPSPPAAPAFPMEETPPAPPPVTPAPSLQTPGSREPAAPTPDVEMSIVEETFASSTSSAKNATRVDLDAFIEGLPSVSFAKTDALGLGREEVLDLLSSRTKAQRKGPLLSPPQCDALVGLIGQIMDLKPGHTSNLYKVLGQVKAELRTTPAVPPTPTLPAPWPAKPTPPALHGEKTSPDIATPPPPLSTEFIDACYDQANDIIYELSDERYLETLSDIGVTEGMSSSASPGSSGSAEQEPGRPSIPAPTGGRISSENGNHKIILKENSENRVYANPPAGVKDVNLAAARDVTLNLPAGTSSNGAARVLVNWADCIEDLSPGAEDDFTVVKTKKRRRESSNSPTAAAPSSNSGGARSSRRLHSSARSVPRAQEIPTTRTHITEARARQASSSEEHCVYLEHGPELQPFHYLRALDRLLGGTAGIIQISKVNGHQLLGLANRGLAERLINNGLEVEGTLLRAFPFRKRAERITVSNLPFFVEDSAIINALRPFGRITSIAPKMMKAGPYTYTDGRREAFIVLHEGMTTERLPTRLNITIKGEAWPAYLSTGIKCSRCHGQGHRRANCPLLAGLANNTRTAPPTTPAGVPPPTTPAPPQRSAAQPPAPTPSNPAMEVCGAPPVARAALHSSAPRPSPPAAPAFPMEETPPAPPPVTPAPSLRTPGSREPAAPTPDVEMSIVEETFASSTSSAKNATRVDLDAFIEGLPSVSFAKTDALGLGREEVLDLLSSRTKAQRKGPLLSPPQCDALVGLIGQILDLKPGHTSNLYKVLGQVRAELTKTPAAAPTPPLPAPRPDGPIPPPPHGDTTTPDMATPPPPPSAQMEVDPIDKRCKELQLLTFELMKEFNPKPLPQFYSFELDLVEAVLYPEDREGFLGRFSPGDKKVLAQILDKLSTRDLDSLTLRGLSELRAAL